MSLTETNDGVGFGVDLHRFAVDPERGFLPPRDPLRQLPPTFATWEEVAADLPKLLAQTALERVVARLPVLDPSGLDGAALRRAMLLLSFIGHGYVWEKWQTEQRDRLPANLAVPWYQVAQRLGRPPVLAYASYALDNWRRLDPNGPIELGNLALLQNFLGGVDEEWFVTVHVDIEAKAGPALEALTRAQAAVARGDLDLLTSYLERIAAVVERLGQTLARMPEHCDPYIYYNRVRPYIHGFSQHPVIYEGVAAYQGEPRAFYGETGAQSTIIPSLDAGLGIEHRPDELRVYLNCMRDYMPPEHRAFLAAIEAGPSIRAYVLEHQKEGGLVDAYNEAVHWLEAFRQRHLEYAAAYIQKQSAYSPYNSTTHGTGGTPFMPYLKKHRDETTAHQIQKVATTSHC
jgi:indoleamine 2,3-dioxygenase